MPFEGQATRLAVLGLRSFMGIPPAIPVQPSLRPVRWEGVDFADPMTDARLRLITNFTAIWKDR